MFIICVLEYMSKVKKNSQMTAAMKTLASCKTLNWKMCAMLMQLDTIYNL
jgi:hypothetical protein